MIRQTEGVYHRHPHGSFSFAIELENLFAFCEDYDKVVYGMRHKLTLVRKSNDGVIFNKFSLYKSIESKIVLDAAFRMRQCSIAEIPAQTRTFGWRLGLRPVPEKPRHVLIAF